MDKQKYRDDVPYSIDTGFESMQGHSFPAQRIMNQERTEQPVMKKKNSFTFILAMILLMVSVAAAGAETVNEDYNSWLYRIWPETAQALRPVNMSCTDTGIRMEVISAVNEGSEVYVAFSMQDLEEDRITRDTRANLSARSGSILTSFSHPAEPLYQPDEKTMVFGTRVRLDGSLQEQQNLQFTVDCLVPVREQDIDLLPLYQQYSAESQAMPVPEKAEAFREARLDEIRKSGPGGSSDQASLSEEDLALLRYLNLQKATIPEKLRVLDTQSGLEIPLAEGVTLSGIGMVDGLLHVQMKQYDYDYRQFSSPRLDHYTSYWICMHDAAENKSFTSIAPYIDPDKLPNGICDIRWKEQLPDGREVFWQEKIFAVDGELTEAQKLLAEIYIYDKAVTGQWQVDIPLSLIREK